LCGDSGDDGRNDDDSDEVTKDDDEDDVESDVNEDKEASDSKKTNSNEDKNLNVNQNDDDEEEHEEEYVCTPDSFKFNDELYKDVDVKSLDVEHEKERKGDAEMTDVDKNVSQERSFEQVKDDAHVTLTTTQKTEGFMQSSSVSSNFASKFLNLDNVPLANNEVASMMNVKMKTPTPIPTTEPMTSSIPDLPDFASLFGSDQRMSALEQELSKVKQVDHSAPNLLQIPAIVDEHLSTRIGFATQTALQLYTTKFKKKAQAEKEKYIVIIEKSVKEIIKDEVKSQLPHISPKEISDLATPVIQSTINESLENVVLAKSSSQSQLTYEAATSLTEFESKKILLDKLE
ncbi:hypothetical protein Tco_0029967, partial [Tanacetum coccineum]